MKEMLKRLVVEEEGQGMVEYGMILGLVAVICVAIFGSGASGIVGSAIRSVFTEVSTYISNWSM